MTKPENRTSVVRRGSRWSTPRRPRIRHIGWGGRDSVKTFCNAWADGGWKYAKGEEVLELPVCKICLRELTNLQDSVRMDPYLGRPSESIEPLKGQVWRNTDHKMRKQTAVITKVADDVIHMKITTDINGTDIAPVIRQRAAIRVPIEEWSRNWVPQ